jgi:O-antigen ligase
VGVNFNASFEHFINFIWIQDKARFWRHVGTLANPNRLGFFVVVVALLGVLTSRHALQTLLISALSVCLLVMASSRISLLAFALVLAFLCIEWLVKKRRVDPWYILAIVVVCTLFFYFGGYVFRYFIYLHSISMILYDEISVLDLLGGRLVMWQQTFDIFSGGPVFKQMFGFGPSKIGGRHFDNDFLATIFRYGFVGAFLQYATWIILFFYCWMKRNNYLAKWLALYIVVLFISGFFAETFSSWFHPIPFFFGLGAVIKLTDSCKQTF